MRGIMPNELVTVLNVAWHGSQAVDLVYKDQAGKPGNRLLYRSDEDTFEIAETGRSWSFDVRNTLVHADGVLRRSKGQAALRKCTSTVPAQLTIDDEDRLQLADDFVPTVIAALRSFAVELHFRIGEFEDGKRGCQDPFGAA